MKAYLKSVLQIFNGAAGLSITKQPREDIFMLRYVRRKDIPEFERQGWYVVDDLSGTHHGAYSVIMRRDDRYQA